ncbi:patatin-like phospholipase family protein [Sporolactobacillus sp. CQH2019]|uniref:patatin-like phospholipase family protein n=1 Tax=Sporolactobacillus sp. CQH2019 TaxID=3023512 RepID=UPI002367B85D|nr:patatin-like phospholipase family protein [Sporolactobacillus sp. CQH2019]MDD9149285.1 patatin-like phospholipase family protein [Sporolactobacillus sp. CQH2019]
MWIDVVFSGGGVKGFAFVGALEMLERSGYRFKRAAGTSAGAIVASLLAAGYSSAEMKKIMEQLNPHRLLGVPNRMVFPFYKWLRIYFKMGLYSGDFLERWLEKLLSAKGIAKFSDLPEGSLKIIVSDVSKGKMAVLPDDLKDYGMNPGSFSVARAVRMSAGLPFFFEPVSLFDGNGERSLMVDGGILSNFPLWIFDPGNELPVRPFIGLQILSRETYVQEPKKIRNAVELFHGLFTAMGEAHDEKTIEKLKESNVVFIPVNRVNTKDFQVSREERERLFRIGAEETSRFLKKWSY